MKCPACSSSNNRVLNTRPSVEIPLRRRLRECSACSHRWTTVETPTVTPARVDPEKKSASCAPGDPDS